MRFSWKQALLLLFAVALGLRVGVVIAKWPTAATVLTEWNDSTDYDHLARSLLRGEGFTAPCGKPTAFRPPLYPVFLAGVYWVFGVSNLGAVGLIQALLGAATAVLAALLARRAGFGQGAGILAGAITAIYPAFLFQTPQILTEELQRTVMVSLFLVLLVAAQSKTAMPWIAGGLLFGLGALNKSVLLAALPFVALWIFRKEASLAGLAAGARATAFFLLPLVLLVGGWTLRNAWAGGAFLPVSSNFPITFAQGVTRHSYYTNLWYGEKRCMAAPDDFLKYTQLRTYCGIEEERRIGRDYESQARRFLGDRIGWYSVLTVRKALHFWGPFVRNTPAQTAVALLTMGPVLLAGWIALLWVLARRHTAASFALLVLAIAIPVTLPHALSQCDVRYRLGLIDPLWIVLGCGIADWVKGKTSSPGG